MVSGQGSVKNHQTVDLNSRTLKGRLNEYTEIDDKRNGVAVYTERLSRLRSFFSREKIDALLVSCAPNVRYLSGFRGFDAHLLIGEDWHYLITDFRYAEQAAEEAGDFEIKLRSDSLAELLGRLLVNRSGGSLGFEPHSLTFEQYHRLRKELKGVKLISTKGLVERLRVIKEETEIDLIARAAKLGDRSFQHILSFIKPGVSEWEVALEIEYFMRKNGSGSMGFEVIVASGPNSARPHAHTSRKKLKTGEFVKLDFGAVVDGYHSDMTRTVVLGKATEEQRRIYTAVLDTQKVVLSHLKVGLPAVKVDKLARDFLEQKGLADKFGHNLGHGVGLKIHEAPTLGKQSKEKLQAGMVFSIEPGVYLSGFGGVRIEDLVVLRQDGPQVLTKSPKELMEL